MELENQEDIGRTFSIYIKKILFFVEFFGIAGLGNFIV